MAHITLFEWNRINLKHELLDILLETMKKRGLK